METRDKLNSLDGYNEIIATDQKYADKYRHKIDELVAKRNNQVHSNNEIIDSQLSEAETSYLEYIIEMFIVSYSKGDEISEIRSNLSSLIGAFVENEKNGGHCMYDQLIWSLSFAIMMDMENAEIEPFFKLINYSDDYLINFLIKSRIPLWQMPSQVEFMIELPYQSTKEVIDLAGQGKKEEAVKRLEKYLTREWYRGNAECGWHNDHKSKFNLHFGYWSFESGALVKILGLDDSILKGLKYYPYDMVHWH